MLFVNTVDTKIKARNAFNAIYVNTVDTKHGYCCGRYASYWNAFLLLNDVHQ